MEELFWEISKPLLPFGKPGLLVAAIIRIRAKRLTAEMVGAMWTGVSLSWHHFLPEDQNVRNFGSDHKVQFTLPETKEAPEVKVVKKEGGNEMP